MSTEEKRSGLYWCDEDFSEYLNLFLTGNRVTEVGDYSGYWNLFSGFGPECDFIGPTNLEIPVEYML